MLNVVHPNDVRMAKDGISPESPPRNSPVRLVLSYPDTAKALGIGRSKVYELVKE